MLNEFHYFTWLWFVFATVLALVSRAATFVPREEPIVGNPFAEEAPAPKRLPRAFEPQAAD